MKMKTRLASLLLLAGFLICNYVTVVNATTLDDGEKFRHEEEERIVDYKYSDYYDCNMGFDKRKDIFYIRNCYTSQIEWEIQPVDKQVWTNTEVYGRLLPNMNIQNGVFLDYATPIHLIGISPNGWDVIEYDGNRYFLWYLYWCEEEPEPKIEYVAPYTNRPEVDVAAEITTEAEAEEAEPVTAESTSEYSYYGCLTLTAYEWTGNSCADGVYPVVGYTAACNNPDLWHRWVYIEGVGTYYIHDTGGMGTNVIDIYMGDVDACYQFGSFAANVYVIN